MKEVKDYIKTEHIDGRTQATLTADECLIYIPEEYFEGPFAEIQSVLCHTLGVFYFKVDGELHLLKMPLNIQFQYVGQPEKATLALKPQLPPIKYRIFKLTKGCAFIWDLHRSKDINDLLFIVTNLIENGKWPSLLSYNELLDVLFKTFTACKEGAGVLDVQSIIIELLIANSCRYKNNATKAMRFEYNGKNRYDYKPIRLTRVTSTLSTLNAIMGEDLAKQLVASVLRTREGKEEPPSEIEEIIKY